MIPSLANDSNFSEDSFHIGIFQDNLDKLTWHYHNHYEISFITEGVGKRIVADSVEFFMPSDLVFIGRNLPHVWIADKDERLWTNRSLEMVFLQFDTRVISQKLLLLPEFKYVNNAIIMSERGIKILGSTLNDVSELMLQMPYLKSIDRFLYLFKILDLIGKSDNIEPLASAEYIKSRFSSNNKRIEIIHDYLMKNYREEINLKNLSSLVNLTEGSLCRFFKENMGLTIIEYLNKIKIDYSCELLKNLDLSILEVCYDSGYNNLSHFNKQFKKFTSVSPKEYRRKYSLVWTLH